MFYVKSILILFSFLGILSLSNADQKEIDDMCFVSYSQSVGRSCNIEDEADDEESIAEFNSCVEPLKAEFIKCCKENKGSETCADDVKKSK